MRTPLLAAVCLLSAACSPAEESAAPATQGGAQSQATAPAVQSAEAPASVEHTGETPGGEPNLLLNDAWAPPPPGGVGQAAVYITIENVGLGSDRLVGAETPIAAHAMLHGHVMSGDVARMEERQAIEIPARRGATLAPGGEHIMLMELTGPLTEGERFPLTLTFERAGSVEVMVKVESLASHLAAEEAADAHEARPEH